MCFLPFIRISLSQTVVVCELMSYIVEYTQDVCRSEVRSDEMGLRSGLIYCDGIQLTLRQLGVGQR